MAGGYEIRFDHLRANFLGFGVFGVISGGNSESLIRTNDLRFAGSILCLSNPSTLDTLIKSYRGEFPYLEEPKTLILTA